MTESGPYVEQGVIDAVGLMVIELRTDTFRVERELNEANIGVLRNTMDAARRELDNVISQYQTTADDSLVAAIADISRRLKLARDEWQSAVYWWTLRMQKHNDLLQLNSSDRAEIEDLFLRLCPKPPDIPVNTDRQAKIITQPEQLSLSEIGLEKRHLKIFTVKGFNTVQSVLHHDPDALLKIIQDKSEAEGANSYKTLVHGASQAHWRLIWLLSRRHLYLKNDQAPPLPDAIRAVSLDDPRLKLRTLTRDALNRKKCFTLGDLFGCFSSRYQLRYQIPQQYRNSSVVNFLKENHYHL